METNIPGINIFAGLPPDPSKGIGQVFWVGNSTTPVPGGVTGVNAAGSAGDAKRPFATWQYAVDQCVAARNDIIFILPGHAETIATATALNINKSGVRTFGLGVGSNRPTFTVATAATATITFSAANTRTENIVVICNLDGLNSVMTVTGADVFLDIEYRDTSATVEADIAITASGARFICNLRDIGFTTGDQREASISMNGVVGARINIDQYGIPATAVVNFVTTLCSDIEVRGTTYVSGTTDGSKNVVDTITGSLWYMDVIDAAAGARYTGGSAAAVASDDISAVNTVLGTISTAAATGAVTSTDTIMAYVKQLVTQTGIEADTDTITAILSGANGITTWKSGAAPATGVSISEALRYFGEQIINGTGTALPTNDSLYGVLAGTSGITTFPTAAAAANAVSIAEVLRYISEYQVPRVVSKAIAAWGTSFTTGLSPVTLFTVTGNVKARVFMVQTTAATSTGSTGTIALGVSGNTGGLAAAATANGTNFPTNSVWAGDTSPTLLGEVLSGSALNWFLIGNGVDIIATIATNDMTAGASTFYCEYIPLDSSSTVVAA